MIFKKSGFLNLILASSLILFGISLVLPHSVYNSRVYGDRVSKCFNHQYPGTKNCYPYTIVVPGEARYDDFEYCVDLSQFNNPTDYREINKIVDYCKTYDKGTSTIYYNRFDTTVSGILIFFALVALAAGLSRTGVVFSALAFLYSLINFTLVSEYRAGCTFDYCDVTGVTDLDHVAIGHYIWELSIVLFVVYSLLIFLKNRPQEEKLWFSMLKLIILICSVVGLLILVAHIPI